MPNTLNVTFPQKLFMLMESECSDVVVWLPHGLAFRILDYKRFADETIPKYFRHTKLTSFQRQLNLYGFRRVTKGEDQGAYFHQKFQHGRSDLVSEIRRLPGKVSLTTGSIFELGTSGAIQVKSINSNDVDNKVVDDKTEEVSLNIIGTAAVDDCKSQNSQENGMKMSQLSMNIGFGRNDTNFVPQSFTTQRFRWIPVPIEADYMIHSIPTQNMVMTQQPMMHYMQQQNITSQSNDNNYKSNSDNCGFQPLNTNGFTSQHSLSDLQSMDNLINESPWVTENGSFDGLPDFDCLDFETSESLQDLLSFD